MPARHVDLVVVPLESQQDLSHSALFQSHSLGNLSVRNDGSIEVMQITVAIKDDRPEFFEGKGTPSLRLMCRKRGLGA